MKNDLYSFKFRLVDQDSREISTSSQVRTELAQFLEDEKFASLPSFAITAANGELEVLATDAGGNLGEIIKEIIRILTGSGAVTAPSSKIQIEMTSLKAESKSTNLFEIAKVGDFNLSEFSKFK